MPVLKQLERIESFRLMSEAGKALARQCAIRKNLIRGAAVLHKGQPVSGAYLVLEGRLRVFTIAPSGTEATLYFVEAGETCVVALNCVFNDLLYPAWVQAETTTSIVVIPGAAYRRLFESEPTIQNLTIQALSTLVYRLMGELEQVHAHHHKQRLAQFILMHAASDGTLRTTQQRLAQHLGTTREVIARLLGEFAKLELVRTARGVVAIRDLFGLRRVVSPDPRGPAS